jgi:hypothetical protein
MSMIDNPLAKTKWTLQDFRAATEQHQKRVLHLGHELFNYFRKDFMPLDSHTVEGFLRLHDQAKTDAANTSEGVSQLEVLYGFFGVDKTEVNENEKFKILSTINHINYLDAQTAQNYFRDHGLMNDSGEIAWAAQNLLMIERIADLVDRGEHHLAPQEFNRKLKKASEFIEHATWADYARHLETNYLRLVQGL